MLSEGNLAEIHGRNLFRYKAEVIREGKWRFYFQVDGVRIEITPIEARMVIRNPRLYYFSTALKLHNLIEHKKKNPNYTRRFD